MGYPDPDIRLKKEYGGVRAALEYCVSLNLNKTQAANLLGIDRATLRERARRYNVAFPDGYATRDTTLAREISRERIIAGNQNGNMGGRRRWKKV